MSISASTTQVALIDLINKDNHTTFTVDDIEVSAPVVIDSPGEDGRNATAVVSSKDQSKYPGEPVTVRYTRRPPSDVFLTDKVYFFNEEATEDDVKKAVVDECLSHLTVPFDEDSYTFTSVTAIEADDPESMEGKFQWKVTLDFTKNYVLYGSQVLYVSSSTKTLTDLISVTSLSGFTKEDVS